METPLDQALIHLAQEQGSYGDRPSGKSRPPASVSINGMGREGQMHLMNYLRDRSSSVSIPEARLAFAKGRGKWRACG